MFRWIFVTVLLSACAVAAVWTLFPHVNNIGTASAGAPPEPVEKKKPQRAQPEQEAPRPEHMVSFDTGTHGQAEVHVYHNQNLQGVAEPIVIAECTLDCSEKQEVPSEKEGKILFIGTDVQTGEDVPKDKQLPPAQLGFLAIKVGEKPVEGENCFRVAGDPKNWYRRWRLTDSLEPKRVALLQEPRPVRKLQLGDWVKRNQLLAQVNPAKASDDVSVKIAKLEAVDVQRQAAYETKSEYLKRLSNYHDVNRSAPGAIQRDTLAELQLQIVKARSEENVKMAETVEAQRTLNAAATDLKMHEIRAEIDGIIKFIYKNHQGDAVKPYEAIMRIENPNRLRVEGRLELQEALKLQPGMTALVEASRPEAPQLVLSGHLGTVNCVAVSKGKKPVIVSGSDDEMLRGWDAATGEKLWRVTGLRSSVRAVACTPPASKHNLACFGCADGSVRLLDLNNPEQAPRELAERHKGPVFGIAFRPDDGEVIATCGDDRKVRLWSTETGELLNTLTNHSGPVTSVQFANANRLVSAGRDFRLYVYDVEDARRAHPIGQRFDGRGGEVPVLGVSPDGKTVLFDQGKELRILTLAHQQIAGTLQNPAREGNFSTMALFSPDGKTILTNGNAAGKLQLWRTPVTQTRGSELRQLIWNTPNGTATCGAFAPDSSFAVTGTQDHKVLVWAMPSPQEIDSRLEARLSLVEKYLDTQSRHVKVHAELNNPGWLIPGSHATMVIVPPKK